jgi:hypothetical protein
VRTMNKFAVDVTAEDFCFVSAILSAEIDKFQAIGDSERARRLIAIGKWIASEWLALAEDRALLAHQLLHGPQLTDDP